MANETYFTKEHVNANGQLITSNRNRNVDNSVIAERLRTAGIAAAARAQNIPKSHNEKMQENNSRFEPEFPFGARSRFS